jgi:hypothetical protein
MSQQLGSGVVATAQRTVTQHIDGFRQLLLSLDANSRQALNAFWKDVRQSLNDQDATITGLLEQIQHLQQQIGPVPQTPRRPPTTDSIDVIRNTVDQAIHFEALRAQDASVTLEEICDLDPTWAMEFIRRQRNFLISNASELGCWMSGNAPAHENGYVKMNMRGTRNPTHPTDNFTVQPFGHQMGVVAGGRGPELRLTTRGEYHVCVLPSDINWVWEF